MQALRLALLDASVAPQTAWRALGTCLATRRAAHTPVKLGVEPRGERLPYAHVPRLGRHVERLTLVVVAACALALGAVVVQLLGDEVAPERRQRLVVPEDPARKSPGRRPDREAYNLTLESGTVGCSPRLRERNQLEARAAVARAASEARARRRLAQRAALVHLREEVPAIISKARRDTPR